MKSRKFDLEQTLAAMETFTAKHQWTEALDCFSKIIVKSSGHPHQEEVAFRGLSPEDASYARTRFVSCALKLFSDPSFGIEKAGFLDLMTVHHTFHLLVAATDFRNTNHAISALLASVPDPAKMDSQTFNKLLFLWSIDAEFDLPFEQLSLQFPDEISALMLQTLNSYPSYTKHAVGQLRQLMELIAAKKITLTISEKMSTLASAAWMFLAYKSDQRREVRHQLNQAFRQQALSAGAGAYECKDQAYRSSKKNHVVVVVERMMQNHAMLRCFQSSMLAIDAFFDVTFCFLQGSTDQETMNLFKQTKTIEDSNIKVVAREIAKLKPKIIIYPSIGMHANGCALANLRLAPKQIIMAGHNDTTDSKYMDYGVFHEDCITDKTDISEKLIFQRDIQWSMTNEPIDFNTLMQKRLAKKPSKATLKIALPCSILKLSPEFIQILERLQSRAEQLIEFNFFPNVNDIIGRVLSFKLAKKLDNVVMHTATTYSDYIVQLSHCDLALGPFPYGNGNGNVDCAMLALPILTLKARAPTGRSDFAMAKALRIPKELQVDNEEEYITRALELVSSFDKRMQLQEKMHRWALSSPALQPSKASDYLVEELNQLLAEEDRPTAIAR